MNFNYLLDGMFHAALADLPEDFQREVARRFHPFRWDDLSPRQRRVLVLAAEGEALGQEDEFGNYWRLYAERAELLRQVSKWWQAPTPTAADMAIQEDRVAALRKRFNEIDTAIALASTNTPVKAAEPVRGRIRRDALTFDIEAALAELGADASASKVLGCLEKYAGKPGSAVVEVTREGGSMSVIWRRGSGELERLTRNALRQRIVTIKRMLGQGRR